MRLHPSLIIAGVGVLLLGGAPAHADPPDPGGATAAGAPAALAQAETRTITLVTGNRVLVTPQGTVGVLPGAGREDIGHTVRYLGSDKYVIPNDAGPLIADGTLDEDLFNVTALASGDFAGTGALPVIVQDDPGEFDARTAGGSLWEQITGDRYEHVWLDQKVTVLLDESVPQIGAPAAWEAGYTGEGVTVAVLDSGYDPAHPDLAGTVTAAEDFTGTSPGAVDDYGHGTYVASPPATGDAPARRPSRPPPPPRPRCPSPASRRPTGTVTSPARARAWATTPSSPTSPRPART